MTCEHCERPILARGWCGMHYQRWRVHGDPLTVRQVRGQPDVEAFWRRADQSGDCWLWTGTVVKGYGMLHLRGGSRVLAHRFAHTLLIGPIPAGLEVDHTCHDPHICVAPCQHRRCVNPAHLEAVTRKENNLRSGNVGGTNARKTHCPQNHPYDEANTLRGVHKSGSPYRRCRTCLEARRARARKSPQAQAARTA